VRLPVALLAGLVVAGASARLLVDTQGSSNLNRPVCRWLLCGQDPMGKRALQTLGQGEAPRPREALELFQTVLSRDLASPYRWCDLGEALADSGQVGQARLCFRRALDLGPQIPPICMRAANFHLLMQEPAEMLRCTSRVLRLAPGYDPLIFSYYTLMSIPVAQILTHGIPDDRRAAQSYFRHLLQSASVDDMELMWSWIRTRSFADDNLAGEYLTALLRNRSYKMAAQTWALHLASRRGNYLHSDRLWNGDFEFPLTGSPLDWKISPMDGVEVERDTLQPYSGKYSLRIGFLGTANLAYSHTAQMVWVTPGTCRFTAQVRTAGITTDQGIQFRILDAEAPARLDLTTAQLQGTHPWMRLERTFQVPAQTHLLAVQVLRRPSLKLDNKITGTAWIDAVSLTPSP